MATDLMHLRRGAKPLVSAIVLRGEANELAFVFEVGTPVAPFSLGSMGDWRIGGEGVDPVHLFLRFDGHVLFAARASERPVSLTPDQALPRAWTRLPEVCEVSFGTATIAVLNPLTEGGASARAADEQRFGPRLDPFASDTIVEAMPSPVDEVESHVPFPKESQPEARGVERRNEEGITSSERHRAVSSPVSDVNHRAVAAPTGGEVLAAPFLETMVKPVISPFVAGISDLNSTRSPRSESHDPCSRVSHASSADFGKGPQSSTEERSRFDALLEDTFKTRVMRPKSQHRALIAGLIVASITLIGARITFPSRSAPSASSGETPPVQAGTAAAATATPDAAGRSQIALLAAAAAPSAPAAPAGNAGESAPAPSLPAKPERKPSAGSELAAAGKTIERQAVDAISRGAYGEASALYEQLATATNESAYVEAARISRRKARAPAR